MHQSALTLKPQTADTTLIIMQQSHFVTNQFKAADRRTNTASARPDSSGHKMLQKLEAAPQKQKEPKASPQMNPGAVE